MDNNVLLEIKDLRVSFPLDEGMVRAVEGVDLTIRRGEVLGVVGESGCGKSITAHSVLRIIPNPGRIDGGQILFHAPSQSSINGNGVVDLARLNPTGSAIRNIRGQDIAMIFQEPMSSFSPVHTIGSQIMEAILLHQGVTKEEARQKAIELLRLVGISAAEQRVDSYPHQFSGG
ncbi:MAG TPA: ATP-binding cassette domain-containing protein, partial [Nitrospiraceae bacterium]|nr:ATP-binding cassette domain-containing protein [Nitrospiraceae bacterium]